LQVVEVEADSPLAQAGIRPGDILLKLDGEPIATQDLGRFVEQLAQALARRPDGTPVLTIYRDDSQPGAGPWVGIALGALAALVIGVLAYLLRRRKRHRRTLGQLDLRQSPVRRGGPGGDTESKNISLRE
jgi:LPXTG-motif cell wall-anchored protein